MPEVEPIGHPEVVSETTQREGANIIEILKTSETREVLAFLSSQFLSFAIYMSVRQLFPLYLLARYSFTSDEVLVKWGIIVTAYTFTGLFGRIPSGWFIERFGRRTSITISYIFMIGAIGGLVYTDNTVVLALLFVILRLTNNVFGLAGRSMLSDLKSPYKGFYNSLISSFGRTGTLVGSIGLGYVLEFLPPFFMIIVAFILAIFGVVLFQVLFIKGSAETMHFIRIVDVKSGKREKFEFRYLKSGSFIFFTISFIVFGIISGIIDPVISLYGAQVLNFSESYIGTLLGLSQLSFIVLSPIIGWLISKKPKVINLLLTLSAILIFVNYFIMYIFYNIPEVYILSLFVKNAAHSLFFPVVFTILTYELPKAHFSILYSIVTTGFFLGVTATSYLSTYIYGLNPQLTWLFAWITALILIGIIILYFFSAKYRKKTKSK